MVTGPDAEDGVLLNAEKRPSPDGTPSICEILREEVVLLKWRVLVFICLLTFGSYYIYDFPSSLGTGNGASKTIGARFKSNGKSYTNEMNLALYSIYSWPNTVLAIFGGLLIDKFIGLRKAVVLFATLVFLGSLIFFVGVLSTNYALLLLGRFVFGLGGESLSVAQSAFVARWFTNGRGIALAFGFTILVSRIGSSFNFLFSSVIADRYGVVTAALFGAIACAITVVSAVILVVLDAYGSRNAHVPLQSHELGHPFHWRQIVDMPVLFWLLAVVCVTVYCSVFPLIGIAVDFFEVKYGLSDNTASNYVSAYQFVCGGAAPFAGAMVDITGRFSMWLVAASAGFTMIHSIFLTTAVPPLLMMIVMGVVYSVFVSALWPVVPYVVQPHVVALAYGIMTSLQNTGLATWPLASGAILDAYMPSARGNNPNISNASLHNTSDSSSGSNGQLSTMQGYDRTEMFFLATASLGLFSALVLFVVDRRHRGALGMRPADRAKAEIQRLLPTSATGDEGAV